MMGIFWAAVIVGIVFLARYFRREIIAGTGLPSRNESAAETLERRYVSGELNREEYLAMKADIRNRGTSE